MSIASRRQESVVTPQGMVCTVTWQADTDTFMQRWTYGRGIGPENDVNRLERLGLQALRNGIVDGIRLLHGDPNRRGDWLHFEVPGQWHDPGTGERHGVHRVVFHDGVGVECDCEIGLIKVGSPCAHIGGVSIYLARLQQVQQEVYA